MRRFPFCIWLYRTSAFRHSMAQCINDVFAKTVATFVADKRGEKVPKGVR